MLPKSSLASRVIIVTSAPKFPAATAWLEPLPPGPKAKEFPKIVSPILGMRAARYAVSATNTPNITIFPMLLFLVRPYYAFSKCKTAIKPPLTSLNDCISLLGPIVKRKSLNRQHWVRTAHCRYLALYFLHNW